MDYKGENAPPGGRRRSRSSPRAHPSASQCPQAITQYITDGCVAGWMVGPLSGKVSELVHYSPIGLVPKGTCLSMMLWSLLLLWTRPCARLIKVHLKNAYRVVPVLCKDCHLLGVCREGSVYVDQALPFGLCLAPDLFTAVTDAVGWGLNQTGFNFFIHYLDDFCFRVACWGLPCHSPFHYPCHTEPPWGTGGS